MPAVSPCLLCILDGWGIRDHAPDNAIHLARTPVFDRLWNRYPHCLLRACGKDVGLPDGQVGNSEVGHINIGAGRVILQDVLRINEAINHGIIHNDTFASFADSMKGKRVHLLGLMSPGGVHGHQHHVIQLVKALHDADVTVIIHAILDGRDTAPMSAIPFMQDFIALVHDCPRAFLGTMSGRYYTMDRDRRWERTEKAWRAIAMGDAPRHHDSIAAIHSFYEQGLSDEFIPPIVIGDYDGVTDGDGLLMSNFRADRVRQILLSLLDDEWQNFNRPHHPSFAAAIGMTSYSLRLNRFIDAMFPPYVPEDTLGSVLAHHHLKQLRLAETEKYAHVTYFFNGGREEPFVGEERTLIPSPRVATYDETPAMSADDITEAALHAMQKNVYSLIVLNFANPDMVGHTGKLDAAIQAVQAVDQALGRLCDMAQKHGITVLVTADHGNAEQMKDDASGQPHTFHTPHPVPFIIATSKKLTLKETGRLADIAPTILHIMELEKPKAMNGHSLIFSS